MIERVLAVFAILLIAVGTLAACGSDDEAPDNGSFSFNCEVGSCTWPSSLDTDANREAMARLNELLCEAGQGGINCSSFESDPEEAGEELAKQFGADAAGSAVDLLEGLAEWANRDPGADLGDLPDLRLRPSQGPTMACTFIPAGRRVRLVCS